MAGVKGSEVPGSGRKTHFISLPGAFSSPWDTWMLSNGFHDLMPALQIAPEVTEGHDSMVASCFPCQSEMLLVLATSDQDSKQAPVPL